MENAVDAAAGAVFSSSIEPAQIAKKAEKRMKSARLVGAGRQYAPTLYNVLVSQVDDQRLFGFYPTIAAEVETYLMAKGADAGLDFDGRPLVRFIVDAKLRKGRFDVIAENVAAPIVRQLRDEEMAYYGITPPGKKGTSPDELAEGIALPVIEYLDEKGGGDEKGDAPGTAPSSLPNLPGFNGLGAQAPALAGAPSGAATAFALSAMPDAADEDEPLPSKGNAAFIEFGTGTVYRLGLRVMELGRDPSCPLCVNDANASRRHARVTQDAIGAWKITDLGSTNGTLLNGTPVSQAALNEGDLVTIGTTELEFRNG
jgi:hypothetical protein